MLVLIVMLTLTSDSYAGCDSHTADESDDWVGSDPLVHFFWQRLEGNEGDYYGMGVAGQLSCCGCILVRPNQNTKLSQTSTVCH